MKFLKFISIIILMMSTLPSCDDSDDCSPGGENAITRKDFTMAYCGQAESCISQTDGGIPDADPFDMESCEAGMSKDLSHCDECEWSHFPARECIDCFSALACNELPELYLQCSSCQGCAAEGFIKKPIIYLYPEKTQNVTVRFKELDNLELVYTYPEYSDAGWEVLAFPDGTFYCPQTGLEYYGLYWEGYTKIPFEIKNGFVVNSEDTVAFLEEKLQYLGLNRREANEFIIYWAPELAKNRFNLIHFSTTEWNELVPLDISPAPDSLIRVNMFYIPLPNKIEIDEQSLKTPLREGFTVVEWGGTELNGVFNIFKRAHFL